MISNDDLRAAARALRAGEPPTDDEIEAYLNGELSADEARRLRERLAQFPELARALNEPFPAADDPDVLEESRSGGHVLFFWRTTAIAAVLTTVVLGVLLLQTQTKMRRMTKDLSRPHVDLENALLLPDGQRGKPSDEAPIALPKSGENYLLVPALIHQPEFRDYRVDIVDLNTPAPHTIWSSSGLHRRSDDTFEIWIPRTFLNPGIYQLVVYGIDGTAERLAKYTVRVPRPDRGAS
ncbi:MAG TPA: hypothetical protein VI670_25075 [Thermoanaerobaculia bacterium]|jgi:hypothetical protein